MNSRDRYTPAAAHGAEIQKDNDAWTLVLVRELRHPPEKVWKAITDPVHLREWAPFDADGNLGVVTTAKLTTVGTPTPHVTEAVIKRAEAPKVLEYNWGDQFIRWELEPVGTTGTRLTLWHNINKNFIAMGAAGWHLCIEVLERFLADEPLGRIVGPDAMKVEGWQRLLSEYANLLGVDPPKWTGMPKT